MISRHVGWSYLLSYVPIPILPALCALVIGITGPTQSNRLSNIRFITVRLRYIKPASHLAGTLKFQIESISAFLVSLSASQA
jgi:hypothetical protein